jgi:hypothetical protein
MQHEKLGSVFITGSFTEISIRGEVILEENESKSSSKVGDRLNVERRGL